MKIEVDSRLVTPGDVFVAIPCSNVLSHIKQALELGASVVFTEEKIKTNAHIVNVPDAFLLASQLARTQYPDQPENVVAITGTNGKSSVAHFVSQFWHHHNQSSACLGTLGLFINGKKDNSILIPNLTTPDAMHLHNIMSYLYENSINYLVFEASSAALDQKRLHSVSLSAAAFTNFASDHLDYHKNKTNYLNAKLCLFNEVLPSNNPAIVSTDDEHLHQAVKQVHANIITYGFAPHNIIRAFNVKSSIDKIRFDLIIDCNLFENLELKLTGSFQLLNALTAIGLVYSLGMSPIQIADTISHLTTLNGRMECVAIHNGTHIFVDYAHTSEGFRTALQELKKHTKNRLICVFGCGGNRDITKRPEMGKIANELADLVIITDDNPRAEEPASIRKAILDQCRNGIEIANRTDAIAYAIKNSYQGDVVAIMGKGHETSQIYGNTSHSFSDKSVILDVISTLSNTSSATTL